MLCAVGVSSIDELFDVIPEAVRLDRELSLPEPLTELELDAHLRSMAASNEPATSLVSFLGAGTYDHYIPSVVDHVVSKPEFFTAYTPYQPEVSQGTLQAIYEYQSMICGLTGMDVANASMYDGATALVEGALMAARVTKRSRILCSPTVHPEWQNTLMTYADAGHIDVGSFASVDIATGTTRLHASAEQTGASLAEELVSGDVAAVLIQSPNFFGSLEDLAEIARLTHDAGALLIVATNPILLGIMEPPSSYDADIVVGEGQSLGNTMSYGGPGLGFFACSDKHVRQMPGRVVGRTTDLDGNRAFVLTLSTREQHIRREKATSNICSNQALAALAACVHLSALGPDGLADVGRSCVAKAHYLRSALLATGRFTAPWDAPFAHEFAVRYQGDVAVMQEAMLERGVLAGVDLARFDAADSGLVLFAVTERRTRAEMDRFVEEVTSL